MKDQEAGKDDKEEANGKGQEEAIKTKEMLEELRLSRTPSPMAATNTLK